MDGSQRRNGREFFVTSSSRFVLHQIEFAISFSSLNDRLYIPVIATPSLRFVGFNGGNGYSREPLPADFSNRGGRGILRVHANLPRKPQNASKILRESSPPLEIGLNYLRCRQLGLTPRWIHYYIQPFPSSLSPSLPLPLSLSSTLARSPRLLFILLLPFPELSSPIEAVENNYPLQAYG